MEVGKYKVIYADPPWKYSFPGTRADKKDDYPTMDTHSICSIPIGQLADKDSVLFLWTIWNKLPDAIDVMEHWGFRYVTCAFTWIKKNKASDSWFWGMGGWTRQNSEICLLGVRGKPERQSASVHSVIDTPIEAHSKKPQVVRDRIVQLMGDVPRVELFARQKTEGWDVWGNEVGSDIDLSTY